MAKQWKIGTAYVEVEARFKWANTMQQQAQQINAAAAKVGAAASKVMQTQAERTKAKSPGYSTQAVSAIQRINERKASQLGLFNPYPNQKQYQGGFPTLTNLYDKTTTRLEKLNQMTDRVIKKFNEFAIGLGQSVYDVRKGLVASGAAAAFSLYSIAEASSPENMNSFMQSLQLLSAEIGSATGVNKAVQGFSFDLQEAAEAIDQWRKGQISFGQLFTGGRPGSFQRMMDINAQPRISTVADAWRQMQMAAAYAGSHQIEMRKLQVQMEERGELFKNMQRENAAGGGPRVSPLMADIGGYVSTNLGSLSALALRMIPEEGWRMQKMPTWLREFGYNAGIIPGPKLPEAPTP